MTKSPSSPRSLRTSITPDERLQLIGLVALADHHNQQLREIEIAALAITQEIDSGTGKAHEPHEGSMTGEALYEMRGRPASSVRRLIEYLGVTVEAPKKPKSEKKRRK